MTDDWKPTHEERMALAANPDALADWRVMRQAAAIVGAYQYGANVDGLPRRALASFGMEDHQHRLFIKDCAR